ncbi:MAG TPA: Rieske (2Fe-2S) protein [Solimonas sp.]
MSRIEVAKLDEIFEGEFHAAKVGDYKVLITRTKGQICAIENRCPHLGLPLARGEIADGAVRCPWHGSRFDLCTGENLDWVNGVAGIPLPKFTHGLIALGKAPAPVRRFEVSVEDGIVYVDVP